MSPTREDFEQAVNAYWTGRQEQLEASVIAGRVGAGTAGSVRGGGHFETVAALIERFFLDAGYPARSVRRRRSEQLALPGYFRPQKQWDVVVVHDNTLVAAFELKALGGPSFGNNYNNRVEEALGSAADLRRAALAKLYPGESPWLGYFFIMEDAEGSRRPVTPAPGPFDVEPIWRGRSYQGRFEVFCGRLQEERLYDAVCYVVSAPTQTRPQEPVPTLDWQHFSAAINARISFLRDVGIPG